VHEGETSSTRSVTPAQMIRVPTLKGPTTLDDANGHDRSATELGVSEWARLVVRIGLGPGSFEVVPRGQRLWVVGAKARALAVRSAQTTGSRPQADPPRVGVDEVVPRGQSLPAGRPTGKGCSATCLSRYCPNRSQSLSGPAGALSSPGLGAMLHTTTNPASA